MPAFALFSISLFSRDALLVHTLDIIKWYNDRDFVSTKYLSNRQEGWRKPRCV